MISISKTARRTLVSSSTGRARSMSTKNHCLQHQRFVVRNRHQRSHSSKVAFPYCSNSNPSLPKHCLRRTSNVMSNNYNRFLSSSAPPSPKPSNSKPGVSKKQKTATTEVVPNVALASVLGGFVTFVFLYSMNAVGRGDGDAAEGNDPLAQLKAEAQEAREHLERSEGGRMTDEEIMALESGLGAAEMMTDGEVDGDRIITEVAVAAPADIAALEEEANLKIFHKQQNEGKEIKKKKPWWRFGF